jgi:hypothetical protein
MQFYLISAILIWKIRNVSANKVMISSLIVLIIISYLIQKTSYSNWFYNPIARIWEFYLGGCFHVWGKQINNNQFKFVKARYIEIIVIVFVVINLTGLVVNKLQIIAQQIILLIASGIFIVMPIQSTALSKFLKLKYIQQAGIISYGLYLWHQPILSYINNNILDKTIFTLSASVFITYLLAQLSYSYIEKPIKENNKISNRYLYALILVNLSFVASLMIQNTLSDWKELDAKEEEKKSKIRYVERGFNEKLNHDWDLSGRNKVILIGDSFAMDFFNVLKEGNLLENINIVTHFINTGCQNVPNDVNYEPYILEQNKLACKDIERIGSESLNKKIKNSNGVIIVSKWTKFTSEHIKDIIKIINDLGISKVIIVGRKEFSLDNTDNNYMLVLNGVKFHKSSYEYVSVIKTMKSDTIDNYIDLHQIICITTPDYYCPVITGNNNLISFDGTHLEKEGAIFISEKLKSNNQFKNIWTKFTEVKK